MRVLICGGRDYSDRDAAFKALDMLPFTPSMVIEGGARGADALGKMWAIKKGIHVAEVRALWDSFGKAAGYKRNASMLPLADYVVAFPGGRGTEDMIKQAKAAGVPVWEPYCLVEITAVIK